MSPVSLFVFTVMTIGISLLGIGANHDNANIKGNDLIQKIESLPIYFRLTWTQESLRDT